MKLSALIQPLIDAKVPHEQIMAVVLAFESQQVDALEQRRKTDAERQARKREREAVSRDVTLRHRDRSLMRGPARVEDKTLTSEIEPQKEEKKARRATRLPSDWVLPVEWRQDAIKAGLPEQRIDAAALDMRDWSLASPNGAKLDWRASWRTWCRRAASDQPRAGPVAVKTNPVRDVITNLRSSMKEAENAESDTQDGRHRPALVQLPAA